MSHVTIAWSLVASCALLLGLMYGFVWLADRKSRASLAFAITAFAVVGVVVVELGMMHAATAAEWGEWVRRIHVPCFFLVSGLALFVRFQLGAGRTWLMWLIIAMRGVVVVLNYASPVNFNFERIDSIARISFLGQDVSVVDRAVTGTWQWFGTASVLLLLVYLADACVTLWRSGAHESRRAAINIGSATFVSTAVAGLYANLTIWLQEPLPALISPPFLILLAAMAFEMSRDTLRASRLARELKETDGRLQFAATAAGLGLWSWDSHGDRVWATRRALSLLGLEGSEAIDIGRMRSVIHPDDIARVESELRQAAGTNKEMELQFRVTHPEGGSRWLTARGRAEADLQGNLVSIQGVLRDVTEQARAREEIEELRRELAHAGRVSVLGTLSSSLAHELNQPLGAIMLNAEAAELMLQRPNLDTEELRAIVADIIRDDTRATDVIDRLRKLLRRQQLELAPLSVQNVIQDVAALLGPDAAARGVVLQCGCESDLPMIRGDKVHLSQVLINLVMNGMDSVADQPASRRRVLVHARVASPGWVEVTVSDSGNGVPPELLKKIFEPFFTTKPSGMGMGLSVSRTIIDSHLGRMWAENSVGGGATFLVALPAMSND